MRDYLRDIFPDEDDWMFAGEVLSNEYNQQQSIKRKLKKYENNRISRTRQKKSGHD